MTSKQQQRSRDLCPGGSN